MGTGPGLGGIPEHSGAAPGGRSGALQVDGSSYRLLTRGNKPEAGKAQLRLHHAGWADPIDSAQRSAHDSNVETTCEPGSQEIRAEIVMADKVQARRNLTIYVQKDLKKSWPPGKHPWVRPKEKKGLGWETLNHLEDLVSSMASGKNLETDYPVERLIEQGSEIQKKLDEGKPWPAERLGPGEYWVALPESLAPGSVRIMVPKSTSTAPNGTKAQPCVLALHGAGGSENSFSMATGWGRRCGNARRGDGSLFRPVWPGANDPGPAFRHLAIDPKTVFVVGHSMGAAQASAFAAGKPEKLKAAAYMGGGGRAGKGETFAALPAFVGVGSTRFCPGFGPNLAQGLIQRGGEESDIQGISFGGPPGDRSDRVT